MSAGVICAQTATVVAMSASVFEPLILHTKNCASPRESASSQITPKSVTDNKMSKRSERLRNKAAEEDPVPNDGKITAAEKAPRTSGGKKKDGKVNIAKSPPTDNSALESRFGHVMPGDYSAEDIS